MSLKSKRAWSYIFSFIISAIILISLGSLGKAVYEGMFEKTTTTWEISLHIMAFFGLASATVSCAKFIRNSPHPIPFISLNIPNFLYDNKFEEEEYTLDKKLAIQNQEYEDYIIELESTLDEFIDELENKDRVLEFEAHITDIYIRHHKNASRLVRSLLQLMDENTDNWKWEFCNNVLDECVTVLHKDRADKSSSVYFVNQKDELIMFAYNRLEFWSSRNRRFKKGDGFAGRVWAYGKTELINDISASSFFKGDYKPKHEYGSILGVPIKIGNSVVGVLCIQSENKDGFTHEDERSVKFYADMCALAHYYDIN